MKYGYNSLIQVIGSKLVHRRINSDVSERIILKSENILKEYSILSRLPGYDHMKIRFFFVIGFEVAVKYKI